MDVNSGLPKLLGNYLTATLGKVLDIYTLLVLWLLSHSVSLGLGRRGSGSFTYNHCFQKSKSSNLG